MSAAEREWEPGDPLLTDNGCGTIPTISIPPQERLKVRREDDTPPPWFRPDSTTTAPGWNRSCGTCNVRWRGDEPCWMCGGEAGIP